MKKGALIFLVVACLIIVPVAAKAMSYVDFLSYGRRFFKVAEKKLEVQQQAEKISVAPVPVESQIQIKQKYRLWKAAYEAKDLGTLFQYAGIFHFTKEEINYISEKELASSSVVSNLKIDFAPDVIKISGYSYLKVMKGDFYAEIKIVQGKNRIYPKVVKARYGKIPVPAMIVDSAIKKETKELIDFLYSDNSYQTLNIAIDDNSLELKYKP